MSDKFNGITEYHDGLVTTDYVNMFPFGTTCVDRLGDHIESFPYWNDGENVRGCFIDSLDNVYIAINSRLERWQYDRVADKLVYIGRMTCVSTVKLPDDSTEVRAHDFEFLNKNDEVTFCESGIKPTLVFCCDGKYVYQWDTEVTNSVTDRQPYLVNMMPLPGMIANFAYGEQPNVMDYFTQFHTEYYTPASDGIAEISYIDWFDNKLVAVQKAKNTVWLTCTNPAQFYDNPTWAVDGSRRGYDIGTYPDLWHNWYASTNSADKLVCAKAYAGQLYFFNSHSVEVWGRTGNEDSPIQSNTTQVIHFGGRNPVIVDNVLYFIANRSTDDEFIAALTPQFAEVSNHEIERRLGKPTDLRVINQRHETFLFVRYADNGNGFLFLKGRWSSWINPDNGINPVYTSIVKDYAITRMGLPTRFDENIRTTNNGHHPALPIDRSIREGFQMFPKRVIFRKVYLTMDTGKTTEYEADPKIYVALSTNRGLSFSQRRYRTLGRDGHNNKEIEWRNLGSGNSVLMEVGASGGYKLQLYDMGILAE